MFTQARQEMQQVLQDNILPFWIDKMQDVENVQTGHANGGFYGQMRGDGTLVKEADKGGILNARILWTFSAACRVLKQYEYKEMATRAFDYIKEHFWDYENGGTYWSVDCQGRPKDTKKQFYAQGFTLYGLSEYARATGSREALVMAQQLFRLIEQHAWDERHGGYIEAQSRDWQPLDDVRLSDKDRNYPKSQNTHLHILEAYTSLFRVWPHPQVEYALRRVLDVFQQHIINRRTGHLDMFFDMDWTPMPEQWESYGHDIECSWLMHEAVLTLGHRLLIEQVEPDVRLLAAAAEKGLQPDGSMMHEANFTTGQFDTNRHWWVQAEAVVGYANLYQHFADTDAAGRALRLWDYIKQHLIDYNGGEWYWSCNADGQINTAEDHAGFWKCPYHNSRMCLEMIERFFTFNNYETLQV